MILFESVQSESRNRMLVKLIFCVSKFREKNPERHSIKFIWCIFSTKFKVLSLYCWKTRIYSIVYHFKDTSLLSMHLTLYRKINRANYSDRKKCQSWSVNHWDWAIFLEHLIIGSCKNDHILIYSGLNRNISNVSSIVADTILLPMLDLASSRT